MDVTAVRAVVVPTSLAAKLVYGLPEIRAPYAGVAQRDLAVAVLLSPIGCPFRFATHGKSPPILPALRRLPGLFATGFAADPLE